MDKELFDNLVRSLKEAKAIANGDLSEVRRVKFDTPDAKAVREKIGLTQSEFASLLRVSIKTLQNWEQHRRNPTGAAAALLQLVSAEPEIALKALHV